MSNTNTAKLDRMQADLTEIRRLMTGLNKFIAEAVLQPDQLQRMVTGAWVHAYPNKGLTWNVEMRGEGFLSLMLGGAETQNTKHKTRNTKHETRNTKRGHSLRRRAGSRPRLWPRAARTTRT